MSTCPLRYLKLISCFYVSFLFITKIDWPIKFHIFFFDDCSLVLNLYFSGDRPLKSVRTWQHCSVCWNRQGIFILFPHQLRAANFLLVQNSLFIYLFFFLSTLFWNFFLLGEINLKLQNFYLLKYWNWFYLFGILLCYIFFLILFSMSRYTDLLNLERSILFVTVN